MPQGQWNDVCWQALGEAQLRCATDLFYQRLAFALAVKQQNSVFAACLGISVEQCFKFESGMTGRRIGISQSASRAHGGASTTANTEVGIDHNLLARLVGTNSFRRANVDASIAAYLLITAMRAEFLFVSKEAGLFKLAHQLTHLEQRRRCGITEITLRQSVLAKGAVQTQVKHHIEFSHLFGSLAVKVDRSHCTACGHTVTV